MKVGRARPRPPVRYGVACLAARTAASPERSRERKGEQADQQQQFKALGELWGGSSLFKWLCDYTRILMMLRIEKTPLTIKTRRPSRQVL
jgi:hypothetical protein